MTIRRDASHGAEYVTGTFNGAIAAAALSAAWDLGVLDELAQQGTLDVSAFSATHDAHVETLRSILFALSSRRIVELDADRSIARVGAGFDEAYVYRGFFYWLTRGCGELFMTLPEMTRNSDREGRGFRRDARAISIACRHIARSFFEPPFHELITDVTFRCTADLGCGSGDRIITLAQQRPDIHVIGIDIEPDALAVAGEAARVAGIEGRMSLIRDDVLNLTARPDYDGVDLVTCFLMGHDFWPRDRCIKVLRSIRDYFPSVENLIIGDTCRSTELGGTELAMFTLGFETVHAVMDQYLPTLDEWNSVVEESGWLCIDQRMIDTPAFSFIYHLVPE